MKRFFILLFYFFNTASHLFATPASPVTYLGIEHGLSNNAVTCIYQDHNGFMWFGTYDGLNRYDGFGFTVFRTILGDKQSIKFNSIYTISGDDQRNVWVGGQVGISIFNPATSKFYSPTVTPVGGARDAEINEGVRVIKQAGRGVVLAGTQSGGLYHFELATMHGVGVKLETPQASLSNYNVNAIAYDSLKNTAYVFVEGIGLSTYNLRTRQLKLVNSAILHSNILTLERNGDLLLGNKDGLYRYQVSTNSYTPSLVPAAVNVIDISTDRANTTWIACDGQGVWTLSPGSDRAQLLTKPDGTSPLNSNAVFAIYEDAENRRWIGTLRGGVNIMQPGTSPFRNVVYEKTGEESVADNFILSFEEDQQNNVWIGTDGAGLRYWNRGANTFTNFRNKPSDPRSLGSNFITGLVYDYNNDLWISTWYGGVNKWVKSSGLFKRYQLYNSVRNRFENNVWLVFEDSKRRLWASSTNEGSLYLFNRAQDRFELFDARIADVQTMMEDDEGNLWCGNYKSLIRLDLVLKRHVVYNIGYPVRSLLKDRSGGFWIGTQEGGLLLFDRAKGKFRRFTTSDGLPNNTILRMLEDRAGNIWLSTFKGLSNFRINEQTFHNFYQDAGLQSNQFSFNAGIALSTGEFLFGGIKGFNMFFPDSILVKERPLTIMLSGLKINNTPVEEDTAYVDQRAAGQVSEITVPYEKAALSLDFLALDYSGAKNTRYAYYLKGWDKTWIVVDDIRTANYSRLQEGTYSFYVKVSSADNKWSEGTELLTVTVLPPWYRTLWAYLFYAAAFGGLAIIYLKYQRRQTRLEYDVKLAQIESQKEKELNEKKIAFFTNVSHEFRTPLSLIINPVHDLLNRAALSADKQDLTIIYRNAKRLLRLVDQLLLFKKADDDMDTLKVSTFNLEELCSEVFDSFTQQARVKNITYQYTPSTSEIHIRADREKLEICLFNLLSNAFKYTPTNGAVDLTLTEAGEHINIVVSDTGIGIPLNTGDRLFDRFYQLNNNDSTGTGGFGIGLYLVKHFVEAHSGTISYTSEPGKGSTFLMQLPGRLKVPIEPVSSAPLVHSIMEKDHIQNDNELPLKAVEPSTAEQFITDKQQMLIIDDDEEMRAYLVSIFSDQFTVYQASGGLDGVVIAREQLPEIIISDVMMANGTGIEVSQQVKSDPLLSHIPILLLTASSSEEMRLQGIESGADDYIQKPFDKNLLIARVGAILKNRTVLQKYFYNEITLQAHDLKVSPEYRVFLERCIAIVEAHLEDEQFSIKTLAAEMGVSHSALYKKVKSVSGNSVNAFIRFIRLRKAAALLINTDCNINEAAYKVGFNDLKYFRTQFNKLFGLNPSDYMKKYRKTLGPSGRINKPHNKN